jgi:hypothetical protein
VLAILLPQAWMSALVGGSSSDAQVRSAVLWPAAVVVSATLGGLACGFWLAGLRPSPQRNTVEVGAMAKRRADYERRAGTITWVLGLIAYYVPAGLVVVAHHGLSGIDSYARAHLLDGLGLAGFFGVAFDNLPFHYLRAVVRMDIVFVAVAVAAVYIANGNGIDLITALTASAFFITTFTYYLQMVPPARQEGNILQEPEQIGVKAVASGSDRLAIGGTLNDHTYLQSADGFRLVMMFGELQLWSNNPDMDTPIWATGTADKSDLDNRGYAKLRDDGVLVISRFDGSIAWSSATLGTGAEQIGVSSGCIVAYANDQPLWTLGPANPVKIGTIEFCPVPSASVPG